MKITLFTLSGNRYRKSGMIGLFRPIPVEYDSSVDVAREQRCDSPLWINVDDPLHFKQETSPHILLTTL